MLPELDRTVAISRIARRAALELEDGDVVNLGIGIPSFVADYIPEDVRVVFQVENGAIGIGTDPEVPDLKCIGAGGRTLSMLPGGSFFSSDTSFGLIRGGHIDVSVLGSLEVSGHGDIANWMIPGMNVPGMGGAMDLVAGARRVYVTMTHISPKTGRPKIVEKCTLPLTAKEAVHMIFTEFAVFSIGDGKLSLREIAPDVTVEDLREHTEAAFLVSPELCTMKGFRS